jgi:phage shock protein A
VAARADALAELSRRPALTAASGLEAELATAAVVGGVQRRLAALRGELGLPPG